jgi:hypothetical protein
MRTAMVSIEIGSGVVAAVIVAVIAACGSSESRKEPDRVPAEESARDKEPAEKRGPGDGSDRTRRKRPSTPVVDAARYETMLLATADCEFSLDDVARACTANNMVHKAEERDRRLAREAISGGLVQRLLEHAVPQLRWQALRLIVDTWPVESSVRTAFVAALDREKDARVMRSAITRVRWLRDPPLDVFLLGTRHADPSVRDTAMQAIVSHTIADRDVPRRFAELMLDDPDPTLRRAACRRAGALRDDAMLATYRRLLVRGVDEALGRACFEGLAAMWLPLSAKPDVRRAAPSRAAYELALEVLDRDVPGAPGATAIDALYAIDSQPAAPSWFSRPRLIEALRKLASRRSKEQADRLALVIRHLEKATPSDGPARDLHNFVVTPTTWPPNERSD